MKYDSLLQTIGNTPLLELHNYMHNTNACGKLLAKLEYFNPASSAKDRIALAMIEDAEKRGIITDGATIIEATSGNTGIGLAMVCAARGYKMILVMPETMSVERRKLAAQYGANVILTAGKDGMAGSVRKAQELHEIMPNSFIPSQFTNKINPYIHSVTTAKEIINDVDGEIDYFIAGVGTGGTVSGVGKALKEKYKNVKIIAVEPDTSPLISQGHAGAHGIQGIGANFIPDTYDGSVIDEVMTVSTAEAIAASKLLAKSEGALVGISSGATLAVATKIAQKKENTAKNIVVFMPDTGERYISTALFD